jgi:hypothetical protein
MRRKQKRLTPTEVLVIKTRLGFNHGIFALAWDYGCGMQTIRDIRSGKTWCKLALPPKGYDAVADCLH